MCPYWPFFVSNATDAFEKSGSVLWWSIYQLGWSECSVVGTPSVCIFTGKLQKCTWVLRGQASRCYVCSGQRTRQNSHWSSWLKGLEMSNSCVVPFAVLQFLDSSPFHLWAGDPFVSPSLYSSTWSDAASSSDGWLLAFCCLVSLPDVISSFASLSAFQVIREFTQRLSPLHNVGSPQWCHPCITWVPLSSVTPA